jgi:endonuclease YncB( thermonuclease family)
MRFRPFILIVTVIIAAGCQAPRYAPVDPRPDLAGKVVAIGDGDSITIMVDGRIEKRVRLFAIDAPEMNQPFGKQSKQNLSDLIYGRYVTIEVRGRDRYERFVGKVYLGEIDVNLEQIRSGFAWHYREFENQQSSADRIAYRDAESAARDSRSGLWTDQSPEPPWRHRKDERENR